MKEWKAMGTKDLGYNVARKIREDEPIHGGNIEVESHFPTKDEAEKRAAELNAVAQ